MSTDSLPKITLHTYFRSSCSARVRIALHHKGLPFTSSYVHLLKDQHTSPDYAALNPSKLVPTLTITSENDGLEPLVLMQSVAIMEYLEERFPSPHYPSLLPPTTLVVQRAKVRQLVNIISCDIQPVTN